MYMHIALVRLHRDCRHWCVLSLICLRVGKRKWEHIDAHLQKPTTTNNWLWLWLSWTWLTASESSNLILLKITQPFLYFFWERTFIFIYYTHTHTERDTEIHWRAYTCAIVYVKVREQLEIISSLLLPCGSQKQSQVISLPVMMKGNNSDFIYMIWYLWFPIV